MDTKVCTKCGEEKPATEEFFHRRPEVKYDGLSARCKSCRNAQIDSYNKKNPGAAKERGRRWRGRNPERLREYDRCWRAANRDNVAKVGRAWYAVNREKIAERNRARAKERAKVRAERRRHDPVYLACLRLRCRVNAAIRRQGGHKSCQSVLLLGAPVAEVLSRLESLFEEGMRWDNWGRPCAGGPRKWQIEHTLPVLGKLGGEYVFDLTSVADQRVAFNYANMAPMWAECNRQKSDTIPAWDELSPELQEICTPRIRYLLQNRT